GDITVTANALNSGGERALAPAQLSLRAASGDIHAGNVELTALANDHGPGGASASANANLVAGGQLTLAALTGNAHATNAGGGVSRAVTIAALDPGSISIAGNVDLSANAVDDAAGNRALAVASLDVSHANNVVFHGDLSLTAHGTNLGSGPASARASADFAGVNFATLQDVTIDAAARNLGHGNGARANAGLGARGAVALSLHDLDLQAQATSHGTGRAVANADAVLAGHPGNHSGAVTVTGNVSLSADAVDAAGNGAAAVASFHVADIGNALVQGSVSLVANAAGHGGVASATGVADFSGVGFVNLQQNVE